MEEQVPVAMDHQAFHLVVVVVAHTGPVGHGRAVTVLQAR
jgi:hypothetical protein